MTSEPRAGLTLRSYTRLVLRRIWWVTGLTLLGLGASLAISLTQAREYSATAQVLVQSATGPGSMSGAPQEVTPTEVQTMLQLVTSAPVLRAVRQHLGGVPPVSATEVAQTNLIDIAATAATPAQAARVANTYAREFVSTQADMAAHNASSAEADLRSQIAGTAAQLKALRRRGGTVAEITALSDQEAVLRVQLSQTELSGATVMQALALVTPAQPPATPSSPRPVQDAVLGLVAGLILGLAAAFLRDGMDDAISSKEAAERLAAAPVLAAVPTVSSWRKRSRPLVVSLARPASPAAEAYRSLRTSLQFACQEHELRSILVTSPAAAEGKTSTLANLGAVFAQAGLQVLMVSCDLRKPRLGQFFGIDEGAGLTTAILGEQPLESLIQRAPGADGLWLLPSGPTPPNPAELLNGARARKIFAGLRDSFDLVLIDSPPILPVTDAVVLSKDVDATLLVVAARTSAGYLQRAAEKLAQVDARVVGVVLNEVSRLVPGYYGGYRGYYRADAPELPAASAPAPVSRLSAKRAGAARARGPRSAGDHRKARDLA